ncbi:MAG TPA: hypothetical protein VNT60_11300, partial [Deinococcales bacterium]|nr:hypothetical protein [Deinococcales bacterium]
MLSKLPPRSAALLGVVATLIAGILWYFTLYSPAVTQSAETRTEIETLQIDLVRAQAARAS